MPAELNVTVTQRKPKQCELRVCLGGSAGNWRRKQRDFIDVVIADPGIDGAAPPAALRGTVFLGLCLGITDWNGKRSFSELDGCIQPAQIDKLIEALTVAKAEAVKLGLYI